MFICWDRILQLWKGNCFTSQLWGSWNSVHDTKYECIWFFWPMQQKSSLHHWWPEHSLKFKVTNAGYNPLLRKNNCVCALVSMYKNMFCYAGSLWLLMVFRFVRLCSNFKIELVPTAHTQRPQDLLAAFLLPCLSAIWRHHILNGKGLRCLVSGRRCPDSAW